MNHKISRQKFLKDISVITVGLLAFSNMLLAAEKGITRLSNMFPVVNDPKGILRLADLYLHTR